MRAPANIVLQLTFAFVGKRSLEHRHHQYNMYVLILIAEIMVKMMVEETISAGTLAVLVLILVSWSWTLKLPHICFLLTPIPDFKISVTLRCQCSPSLSSSFSLSADTPGAERQRCTVQGERNHVGIFRTDEKLLSHWRQDSGGLYSYLFPEKPHFFDDLRDFLEKIAIPTQDSATDGES